MIRDPLVVDPRDHISDDDYEVIMKKFDNARGAEMDKGRPMYFITPYNKGEDMEEEEFMETKPNTNPRKAATNGKESSWCPSVESPEWVVVKRAVALAKRSHAFMTKCLKGFDETDWSAIFQESTTAFKSYSVLFRVHSNLIFDEASSSTCDALGLTESEDGCGMESAYTRSMKARALGPKPLRRKNYRNLQESSGEKSVVVAWQPIRECVKALRDRFSSHALFFYNELSPQVIGIVWRPGIFAPMAFSVMNSDYAAPAEDKDGSRSSIMVVRNASDLIREMNAYCEDIVVNVKLFDESCFDHRAKRRKVGEAKTEDAGSNESSSSDEEEG
jgi:U3 small nucleolar RNA-associated protein 22